MNELALLSVPEQEAISAFVRRLFARGRTRFRSVVLFGSKARGDSGPDSDVDLLVVLADDDPALRSEVRRLAARVSLEYSLLLSVRAVGRSQWDELARHRFPLYRAVLSEGIDVGLLS